MAISDVSSRRQSLLPSFLYSSSSTVSARTVGLEHLLQSSRKNPVLPGKVAHTTTDFLNASAQSEMVIASPNEKIQMYSPMFYAACTAGGIFSCGLTHMTVTPLDLVKCNMQVWF